MEFPQVVPEPGVVGEVAGAETRREQARGLGDGSQMGNQIVPNARRVLRVGEGHIVASILDGASRRHDNTLVLVVRG